MTEEIELIRNMQITAIAIIVVLTIYLIIRIKQNRIKISNYDIEKDEKDYHEYYLKELVKICEGNRNKAKTLIRNRMNENTKLSIKQATIETIIELSTKETI